MDKSSELEKQQKEWENTTLSEALKVSPEKEIYSEVPKERLYTPNSLIDFDYLKDLGFPGDYPFTRGIHPSMYRSRLWGMAQYSGFGTPEDTNNRFKHLLEQGQTGVSLACDLPTQLGYDPDHPLAYSEVGVVGVSCASLKEAEIIFDGIPLDRISVRGSISHPHSVLWSMYMAVTEQQGHPIDKLAGNVHIDCLQEYLGRGAYIFPPEGAMRLTIDFIEYAIKHMPKVSYHINCYTIRESGATLIQEGAYAMAAASALIDRAIERGLSVDDVAHRLSVNSAIHTNLFDEVAKFRALRRLWAKTLKEKYQAKKSSSIRLSIGPGTGGSTFMAQEPLNNIVRATIEGLAAVLSGVTYLHVAAFDEAYAIPTEESATLALRTQQIIAHESGVTETVDPLGGSYYVESLTNKVEEEIAAYLKQIEAQGGVIKAIESGWMQSEIASSSYKKQKAIEEGKKVIVGVNKFTSNKKTKFEIQHPDPLVAREMKQRVENLRKQRDNTLVQSSLEKLEKAAEGKDNLVPFIFEAVKNYATIGEICTVLRKALGEYQNPVF